MVADVSRHSSNRLCEPKPSIEQKRQYAAPFQKTHRKSLLVFVVAVWQLDTNKSQPIIHIDTESSESPKIQKRVITEHMEENDRL